MKKLAILGLGHIGQYVYETLKNDSSIIVNGFDLTNGYDLSSEDILTEIIQNHDGVLASTPFFLNRTIAKLCDELKCDYFDLTESVEVTNYVKKLFNARFVTQCGLAPGMVSIIAHKLAQQFNDIENIEIRVGALPKDANNHMSYYRTWNTEGLLNEYIHDCPAIEDFKSVVLDPLTHMEKVVVQGITLEAATTSGGLGSLSDTYENKAKNVNYKTLRFPGHWEIMKFLKDDLGLKENFEIYVNLFNSYVPKTTNDQIIILINVTGRIGSEYSIRQYSKIIDCTNEHTAIQISTGSGVLSVIDNWNKGHLDNKIGWIKQEELDYNHIVNSQYSNCYFK